MVRSRNQEMLRPIEITCFYEELPLPGFGTVVPAHSAILPGYVPIGIRSNHMDITKFEHEDDPGFIAIAGELRRWIKGLTDPGNTSALRQDGSGQRSQSVQQHGTQLALPPNSPVTNFSGSGNQSFQLSQNYESVSTSFVQPPNPPLPRPPPSSTLPFRRDPDFVDRDIFSKMDQKLSIPASRVALVGLGGVGKSQLAIEYSYRVRDKSPKTWVFWVHAGTVARFEEGYRRIAETAKIDGLDKPNVDVLQLVSMWLCDEINGKWVMIVDNADDLNVLFKQTADHNSAQVVHSLSNFIPQSQNGSIVLTSRNRNVAFRFTGRDSDIIKVDPMNEAHAIALLHKKLEGSLNMTGAAELVQALDYMPLAITQAAAYISQRAPRINILKYLQDFRRSDKNRASLLQRDTADIRRDSTALNSIMVTWQISFEHIREEWPSAARLLSLMSLFDRQGIPEDLLHQNYHDNSDREADFENDISVLTSYSLVTIKVEGNEFEMHRLVQFSMKIWLELYGELEEWKEKYIGIIGNAFPVGRYENRIICSKLFPHAQLVSLYYPRNEAYLVMWASILFNAAWYCSEVGSYKAAEDMDRRALEGREKALGEDHPDTLTSVSNLALVLQDQGKYEQAEELSRRALGGWEKALGEDHSNTLTSVDNLASVLQKEGKYEQAEELNRRALGGWEKVLGEDHPDTLRSVNNLASVLQYQGKYEQAEELNRRALGGREKVLGEDHPDTLRSVNNLASVLQYQGKYEQAEELNRQALGGREMALGEDHPDTLTSVNNLASVLQYQGKYEQAEELNRRALEGWEKVLGEDHPDTLRSVNNLASVLQYQGKYEQAEELNRQALGGREMALGEDHPDTLRSVNNLALVLQYQGKYEQAEELNRRALEGWEKVLGEDHPDTLRSVNNLALVLQYQGKYKQAEELNRRALEGWEKVLGEDHPDTLTSIYCLAYLLHQQERYTEALVLYQRAYTGFQIKLGEDHPTTKACSSHFFSLLEDPCK
ncbi:TPR domain protein [Tricladium varicosporioides]|nr:TPR domain protein [Hymenoscyphus varicosporioides]